MRSVNVRVHQGRHVDSKETRRNSVRALYD